MYQLLFGGQLTPEQQGPLADHAATCPTCHAVVEAMVTQHGPAHSEPRPLTVGSVISGRFRIDQVLGAGGMGIVVAATHTELGNRVAIKFMRDEKLASAEAVERFIREARAVVKLRTEHVCRVHDVARLDTGAPYIVMELLQGVDLSRAIASRPLPATIAVEYVMQAAVALAEAHAAGIVHRDLKPANLFVTRRQDGGPLLKVLDFGIAKALTESDSRLTRTRAMLGSPRYISPEQLDSPRDVDGRSDIWAGPLPPPPGGGMPDAGVAPSAPGPAPPAAEPARASAGPPTPLSSFAAERQRCDATPDPGKAASLPSLIVRCWCQSHDTVHAHAA
jgi:serine/threonine-protein kinase